MAEGIALRNVLCIRMHEGATLTLDGSSIFEHCTFWHWDHLPATVREGLVRQGIVKTEGGRAGAMTRSAVLDSLAWKMAGVSPRLQWPPMHRQPQFYIGGTDG